MKIKLFIVTYNNSLHLNEHIQSFYNMSDLAGLDVSITVVNNHSNFHLDGTYWPTHANVSVLHNQVRPDESSGNLARSWNQCLLNGFKSLTNPDCDLLIHCQDDILWQPNGFNKLLDASQRYDLILIGPGDQVVCVKPEAIRHIGLWDERIHSCGFHEMEYYLRSVLYYGDKVSINDIWHKLLDRSHPTPYLWNPLSTAPYDIASRPTSNDSRAHDKVSYSNWHYIGREVFKHKWGRYPETYPLSDVPTLFKDGPLTHSFVYYPWFEKDIYNLTEKKYIWCDPYSWY